MNTFELSLDLDKSVGAKQWITLRQGDKRGTTLQATLYDHGVLVSGSYTCRVSIRHPNRDTYYRETATYSNGVATVTIDETSAASVVGVTEGYFELLQGSTLIASTESFGVRVLQSATDGATVGPPYDSAIEDALAELDEATGRISQMVVDATAEYLAAHPEITTTVQDNSVTDAKLIQSGGVLDRVGRLWWRLENLLTATPAEAESVTVSDAAKTPVAGLTVFGKSTQDGTPTPSAPVAIESVVAPNLLDLSSMPASSTSNGITFKPVFKDGLVQYVTLSGTSTDRAKSVEVPLGRLPDGTYTFSLDNRVQNVGAYVRIVQSGSSTRYIDLADGNVGERSTFTVSGENDTVLIFDVRVGGVTLNDHRIRPVLNAGSIAYPYTPYGTMGLLTAGRNLWKMNRSMTVGGVTFTVAADGTVTMNGTATSTLNIEKVLVVPKTGTYRLSGCPSGGGASSYQLWTTNLLSTGQDHGITDTGSGGTGTLTEGNYIALRLRVQGGYTCNNIVVRPMLEVGATAHAYEPYKESMTVLPLGSHTLRSLPDGTRDEVSVDQYGHVTLIQRVGEYTTPTTATTVGAYTHSGSAVRFYRSFTDMTGENEATSTVNTSVKGLCSIGEYYQSSATSVHVPHFFATGSMVYYVVSDTDVTSEESAVEWVNAHPMTIVYPLENTVTHDLGTIDPTALVGPDLTAQAVPTAPFALTYERDLNATLARLEAALATLA